MENGTSFVILSDPIAPRALLASEALKNAALLQKEPIEVEVRSGNEVLAPFKKNPGPEDRVFLIGPGAGELPPGTKECGSPDIDEVLRDPQGALCALLGKTFPKTEPLSPSKGRGLIVAVTSCPTGIAHTFMAAEGLEKAARSLGYEIRVETQGSVGAGTPLTPEEIRKATLVLIAADTEVERGRFAGKRVFTSGTKLAIASGEALIRQALIEARFQPGEARIQEETDSREPCGAQGGRETQEASDASAGSGGPYRHLMTGVSFMIPFVVAGGLLIALGFAFGGIYASDKEGTFGHALFTIGASGAFSLIVPILAGYIAFSIADRPGLAPGMVGGVLAAQSGSGFLGGIAAGFIAGYSTRWMNRAIRLPRNLAGLKPVLILPLLGTLFTGLLMYYVVGSAVAEALKHLTRWLTTLQGTRSLVLGAILGGMMAADMGGPINKAAYAFAVGLIASDVCTPMAAVMAAGMTPPLAVALACRLFRNRFLPEELEASNAAAVLGLSFVTEGAIPFAARDPLRVIPSLAVGSALAGALSMLFEVELKVPHGGIFVLTIPGAATHLLPYFGAIASGTAASALLLGLLKRPIRNASPAK